jgi:ergothioneine biosynthesis protein EgtC
MCRFLVYKGRDMLLSDLLTRSEQSLIRQSFKAREREEPLNGDGFGVGWYNPEIDPTPCVFNSIRPAWGDRNLHRLADKIRSTCVFAHVRAASYGLSVSELNCHPFEYDRFLWMHNGGVANFTRIKRRLRATLSDEMYNSIEGTTDSEHIFALYIDQILQKLDNYTAEDLVDAMKTTINQLNAWTEESGATVPSRYNFAVTDGQTIVATRYINDREMPPHSLYVSTGDAFENVDGQYRMRPLQRHANAVIIASEPLTEDRSDWTEVPRNHIVLVTPELHMRTIPIE